MPQSQAPGSPDSLVSKPLTIRALERHSLEDFDDSDPRDAVETPRSLAACAAEGIRPQDLVFVPRGAFELPGVPPEVARLRFEFFEAHRQDLLRLARAMRDTIIGGEGPMHSMAVRADPKVQYRSALEWFLEKSKGLDLKIIPVNEDWSKDARSVDFKRGGGLKSSCSHGGELHRAAELGATLGASGSLRFGGAQSLGGASGKESAASSVGPRFSRQMVTSESAAGRTATSGTTGTHAASMSSWFSSVSAMRSTFSEEGLGESLRRIRSAPGTDWRELEAARRVEDSFGPLEQTRRRLRDERHEDEQRLGEKRMMALTSSFKHLEFEEQRKVRLREIREYLSAPKLSRDGPQSEARARESRTRVMKDEEQRRREHTARRVERQQALEKWVDDDRLAIKVKFAQKNLEDRVRWRYSFAEVEEDRNADRMQVFADFQRKTAQLDAAAGKVAENNAMKRELFNLRQTHRILDEYRRRRKEEHERGMQVSKIKEGAERRIQESGGRIRIPPWCIAATQLRKSSSPSMQALLGEGPPSPGLRRPRKAASSSPQGRAVSLLDVEGDEQLSPEEFEWLQKVTRPKGVGSSPARHEKRRSSRSVASLDLRTP